MMVTMRMILGQLEVRTVQEKRNGKRGKVIKADRLIDAFEQRVCLWEVVSKDNHSKEKKEKAFEELETLLGISVGDIKEKIEAQLGREIAGFHCHAIKIKIENHLMNEVKKFTRYRRYINKYSVQASGLCGIPYSSYLT